MYSIVNVVYGYPLVSNDLEESSPKELPGVSEALAEEQPGFLAYYSGATEDTPSAFGIDLGQFDEACAYVVLSDLHTAPTDEQKAEFQELLAALDHELQATLRAMGDPSVFLLWSTS